MQAKLPPSPFVSLDSAAAVGVEGVCGGTCGPPGWVHLETRLGFKAMLCVMAGDGHSPLCH